MFRAQGHQLAAVPYPRFSPDPAQILTPVCLCHPAVMQYNLVPAKDGDACGAWRKVTAV